MKMKSRLMSLAGLAALIAAVCSPAFAQTTPASTQPPTGTPANASQTATDKDEEVVKLDAFYVSGLRASLASAEDIKQSDLQIVDSIVASDIDRLPDINASYALSRIPGIQVAHTFAGLGGNGGVTIQGLTQIESTIDGNEVITPGGASGGGVATGTRTFDYSQIPSALIAGIDVYKTSAADQMEGGLGGLIDVRMRKPFDFAPGVEAGFTVGTTYSSLRDKMDQNYSIFANASAKTEFGKIGILVAYSDNKTPWREDSITVGNPTPNATITAGDPTALTATSFGDTSSYGVFDTVGFNAVLQWQAAKNLQLFVGVNDNKWKNTEEQVQLSAGTGVANTLAGSGTMFPGSTTATQVATFSNVTAQTFGDVRDLQDELNTYTVGGKFTSGDLTVNLDLSHDTGDYRFYNNAIYDSVVIPSVTYNLAGAVPSVTYSGVSLEDPSKYTAVQAYNRIDPANSKETQGRLDAEYDIKDSFFSKILAGVRYANSESDDGTTGLFLGSYNIPSSHNQISELPPGLFYNNPLQNFFSGYTQPQFVQYITANFSIMRDPAALLNAVGDTTTTPTTDAKINPLSLFNITEKTDAIYLMPEFTGKIGGLRYDGNFGVRFVETTEDLNGNQTVTPASLSPTGIAVIGPINIKTSYSDWLPSFNYRLELTDKVYLRLAVSKTITRPNFGSLSPSLTLNANPISPNLNSGSQGNPNLQPIRSNNYDLSLEYYPSKSNLFYATVFQKDVTGFIASVSTPQTYNGLTYLISSSANLNPATIKGAEAGFQQFFTFLPAPFDGFGVQANYTYVDGTTPTAVSIAGVSTPVVVPLTNLSKGSYNVVAMYEKGPFSARLAYNWRDKYITGVSYFVNIGLLDQEVRAYGDLDASLNYQVSKNVTLAVQAVNLTDSIRYQYWGSQQHPSGVYIDGVSLMTSITLRY